MANPEVAYEHTGTAAPTQLAAPMEDFDLSFTAIDGAGYPTGAGGPFFITFEEGTPQSERVLCSGRVGNVFSVQAASGRGADGTVARRHSINASIKHTWSATEATQLSQHISKRKDVHGVTSDLVGIDDAQLLKNKTFLEPVIASLLNAQHTHLNAAGGGALTQAAIANLVSDLAAINAAIALKQASSAKGVANGYAGLDASTLLLQANLPAIPYANLPVGTGAAEVSQGSHTHQAAEAAAVMSLTQRTFSDGDPIKTLATSGTLAAGRYLILASCNGFSLASGGTNARLQYDLTTTAGTLRAKPVTQIHDSTSVNGGTSLTGFLDNGTNAVVDFTGEKQGTGALLTSSTQGMLVAIRLSGI